MYRYAAVVLSLALGIAFQLSHGTEVNVTDKDNNLCLYANLMVNFSVSYDTTDNKSATTEFELPETVTSDGSKCDTTSSLLKINFGEGHSWSMNFTVNGKMYQIDTITFSYNLGDTKFFPKASTNETANVYVKPHITDVGMDTCYSCKSKEVLEADLVNQTLWNVLIQAFVSNNITSENITSCAADVPTTPVAPTTHATSTAAPITNATSTVPTTTTPTPPLPTPTTGKYHFKPNENSTVCLMAYFGLRVAYKQAEMNFDPNGTTISGSCGDNTSELVVVSNTMTIMLTFVHDTKKFRLHALNITGKTSAGVTFSEANTNLSLWEAAVGSSYMCNKEQSYNITSQLTIDTFDLQVQPFGVKNDVFSTAEECFLDSDLSFLVPIAVGVALSFLIILVLISYLIGRRKSRTGYQSV
ncbi:lysosome-associated membrane glycoprotein 2 isoform X2 [Epinephelus fuscoguttatus]|uniref:lysosome-associated membrane glycoprotein 2 isoform X2 n=1 Tax=Epinephelus fuscoguttatus TaxID=293821 RepID=UPI0020D14462|nr:lysosome-associated membrane glycoprotein 2 isoform X2 [Epinephelus fuscoguttatus]